MCSSVFYFFVSSLALICFSLYDRFSLFLCFFNNFGCTGATALDILIQSPGDLRDTEIEEFLIHSIVHEWAPTKIPQIAKSLTSTLTKKESSERSVLKHQNTY